MKRFIISILFVTVFCVGLGALVDKAGAKFKSDEKALALIQLARQAIGGNSAIANVQSLRIVGQTTRSFMVDGVDRSEKGETEIAMQLPDKLMKMVRIGSGEDGLSGNKVVSKQVEVVVASKDKEGKEVTVTSDSGDRPGVENNITKILVKKADGTVEEINGADADGISIRKIDGDKDGILVRKVDGANGVWNGEDGNTTVLDGDHKVFLRTGDAHDSMRHNELLRLTLGLLLTAPEGLDVNYTFGGVKSVDGTSCNLIIAETGGTAFKIYLRQSSNLPVMMTYTGMKMPNIVRFHADAKNAGEPAKDMVFARKVDGGPTDMAEFSVKFSDYRFTGGVQLPYKWVQTVGGMPDETFDVTSYEINPANIAEKFQNQKVMFRTKSDQ